MDKLIEEYKKKIIEDDGGDYGYPHGLKKKIIDDANSDIFCIPVKVVDEMIKQARYEGALANER